MHEHDERYTFAREPGRHRWHMLRRPRTEAHLVHESAGGRRTIFRQVTMAECGRVLVVRGDVKQVAMRVESMVAAYVISGSQWPVVRCAKCARATSTITEYDQEMKARQVWWEERLERERERRGVS